MRVENKIAEPPFGKLFWSKEIGGKLFLPFASLKIDRLFDPDVQRSLEADDPLCIGMTNCDPY